jgi:hypothetical protein
MTRVVSENDVAKTAIRVSAPLRRSEETLGPKASAFTVPQSQSVGWHLPQACTLALLPITEISRLVIPLVLASTFVQDPSNWFMLARPPVAVNKSSRTAARQG